MKVLVVDDEQKILTVMQKILKTENYNLLTSEGPEEALEMLESQGPISVVLTDNRMPVMTGTEFLEKVKTYSPDTVRMIMTAHYDPHLIEEVINKGEAFRYLKKPLDFTLVKKVIKEGLLQYKKNCQLKELNKKKKVLEGEKTELADKAVELDEKISGLKSSKKMLVGCLVFAFLLFGVFQYYQSWIKNQKMEASSQKVGHWVVYKNGTAIDTRSELMWMLKDYRNLNRRQPTSWDEAMAWADEMNERRYAGFTDWRLPIIKEYKAIYDSARTKLAYDRKKKFPVGYPKVFSGGGGYGFWSSEQVGTENARYFFFVGGYGKTESKKHNNTTMSVRLVR